MNSFSFLGVVLVACPRFSWILARALFQRPWLQMITSSVWHDALKPHCRLRRVLQLWAPRDRWASSLVIWCPTQRSVFVSGYLYCLSLQALFTSMIYVHTDILWLESKNRVPLKAKMTLGVSPAGLRHWEWRHVRGKEQWAHEQVQNEQQRVRPSCGFVTVLRCNPAAFWSLILNYNRWE